MARDYMTAMDRQKKKSLLRALASTRGNISRACFKLGISRQTAYRWIDKFFDEDDEDEFERLLENYKSLGR